MELKFIVKLWPLSCKIKIEELIKASTDIKILTRM